MTSNVERYADEENNQKHIGEAIVASSICRKRSIFDGRILVGHWVSIKEWWNKHYNEATFELSGFLTEVVLTPQSSGAGAAAGAAGVSMNSKSSEDSECVLAILTQSIDYLLLQK